MAKASNSPTYDYALIRQFCISYNRLGNAVGDFHTNPVDTGAKTSGQGSPLFGMRPRSNRLKNWAEFFVVLPLQGLAKTLGCEIAIPPHLKHIKTPRL